MGIVRNPANTMRRGRVGETTYYISGGQQIARQALNSSNFGESARRSDAQQRRRVMWANLVNFYKASRNWMPKAFETKKRNQSDYNKFVQVNINKARIPLTKETAAAGGCIADNFIVSQGSLPSVQVSYNNKRWLTNISVGSLQISDETTNAELTQAMVDNNANIHEGMQISFVSYQQSVDTLGTPRVICRCYEITLDLSSTALVRDYLPEFCSQSLNGFLATSDDISEGGFAYIVSSLEFGTLQVSTQELVINNTSLIFEYTRATQLTKAINSYGVDKEVVLSPLGTVAQSPEAQPVYLSSLNVGGTTYYSGSRVGTLGSLANKTLTITLSNSTDLDVDEVEFVGSGNGTFSSSAINKTGKVVTVNMGSTTLPTEMVKALNVVLSDGTVIDMSFDASQTGGDL